MMGQLPSDQRRCTACGGPVAADNRTRYCSNACRQRAYRARVTATGGTHDAPPPTPFTADAPGAALDDFVGRRHEIDRIRHLFRRHRLVTLVGPAGVGKSRLAMEFVGRLPGDWSRSVTPVLLDGIDDGELVSRAVATAAAVREQPDTPIADTLFAELRSTRSALLLDNCEHVVDSCAKFVDTALRRCGGLRVLATSREALNIPGEAVFGVDGLPVTAADEDVANSPADAVRLFANRARALVHDFRITSANTADVAAICADLDGNPLAIELAARWVPVLSLRNIRERLANRFELLATNRRSTHSRQAHRSLREAIDWGYELLGHDERAVFRRLSLLTGSFDLDAATAACADTDLDADRVFPLLCQLRAKSLLTSTQSSRFRQLESIRLYARQRLDASGEAAATENRLITWLAELSAPLVREPLSFSLARLRAVEEETDNLLSAVRWTAESHDPRNAALAIAAAWGWLNRGHVTQGRDLLKAALARSDIDPADRCVLLSYAGYFASIQCDAKDGVGLPTQALDLARSIGSPIGEACARYALGIFHSTTGQLDEAERQLNGSAAVARAIGDPVAVAIAGQRLAWVALAHGDVGRAATLMAEVLAALEGRPAVFAVCRIHCAAGIVAIGQDDDDRAEQYFTKALRSAADRWLQTPIALEGLAMVAQRAGRPIRALRLFCAAKAVRRGDTVYIEPDWLRQIEESLALTESALGRRRVEAIAGQAGELTARQLVSCALEDNWPDPPQDRDPGLDDEEREMAALVADGLTNGQIADRLDISVRTVAYRLKRIRAKLELSSRTELRAWLAAHPAPRG